MGTNKNKQADGSGVDYSDVTPATGMCDKDKPIADSLANQMPTADTPGVSGSFRVDPDKTIPGPEAAAGVDKAEEDTVKKGAAKR